MMSDALFPVPVVHSYKRAVFKSEDLDSGINLVWLGSCPIEPDVFYQGISEQRSCLENLNYLFCERKLDLL